MNIILFYLLILFIMFIILFLNKFMSMFKKLNFEKKFTLWMWI